MFNWIKNFRSKSAMQRDIKALRNEKDIQTRNLTLLRAVLGGAKPGSWASDHYVESQKYKGWVYAAVNAKMTQCRQSILETNMDENNWAYGFLKRPNPYQSRRSFEAYRCQQLELTGTCVVWNVPEKYTDFPERYIIPTALLIAQRGGYFRFSMTSLSTVYWLEIPSRLMDVMYEQIPFRECTLYRYHHPYNLGDGFSPVSAGSYWIDTADQIDIARFNFNANSMRPGGILSEDDVCELTTEDWNRLKSELESEHGGSENQGKYLKLPKGVSLDVWMKAAEELQHAESFIQQRDAIFTLFNVPPIAVGATESASYSQFFAAMLQFTENVMQPYLDWIAEADKHALENDFDWVGFSDIDEFRYKARRLDDPDVIDKVEKRKIEVIREKIQSGCYQKNEIREFFGDKPLTELNGQIAEGTEKTSVSEKDPEDHSENQHKASRERTNIDRPEKVMK